MYLLFELTKSDLLFIFLAVVALIILGIVIFYVVTKNKKVKPIAENERFDEPEKIEEKKEDLTEEQKQAKAELERVFNMMSADLEASREEPSVIDKFEQEQEENAIISYQELIKQAKAKGQIKEENEELEIFENDKEDYYSAKISDEVEYPSYEDAYSYNNFDEDYSCTNLEENHDYKVPAPEGRHVYKEEGKKFKNSEFISPIFGIQGGKASYPTVKKMERTKNEESSSSKDDNEQFLNSLKEFRDNL